MRGNNKNTKTRKKKNTPALSTETVTFTGPVNELIERADILRDCIIDKNINNNHPHAYRYNNKVFEHYFINNKGWLMYQNGDNVTPLCYGSLVILETIEKDNGNEKALFFKVEAVTQTGRVLHPVIIPAVDFDSLNWIRKEYGADIVAAPTQSAKQKLIAGVVLTGQAAPRHTEYIHTGYILENGRPVSYVHAGGCIGSNTDINAAVIDELKQYSLTGVSANRSDTITAIKSSLQLIKAHAPGVVFPLFAFIYTAPLRPVIKSVIGDTGLLLYLCGETQSGKSTLAALALSHFGSFSSMTPPANFNCTPNYLNELSFYLKDCILWVDDFHPQGSKKETDRQNTNFQLLARSSGDHAGRGRLNSNAQIKAIHRPRCLYLATGEDMPQIGQSGTARVFTLSVNKERHNIKPLLIDAKNGVLSRCMADYINYIVGNYEDVKQAFTRLYNSAFEKVITAYGENSLSKQTALLYAAFDLFISYAEITGAVFQDESQVLKIEAWKQITGAADNIETELVNQDPAKMYIRALTALISSGRRILVNIYDNRGLDFQDEIIGWKDSNYYFLEPNAAYKAVYDYYLKENTFFNCSRQTIQRKLLKTGVITSPDNTPTVVKKINDKSVRVIKINRAVFEDKGGGAYD